MLTPDYLKRVAEGSEAIASFVWGVEKTIYLHPQTAGVSRCYKTLVIFYRISCRRLHSTHTYRKKR